MFKFSAVEKQAALDMMYSVRSFVLQNEYICDAIGCLMEEDNHRYPTEAVGRIIKEEIARRLGGNSATYTSWLWTYHRGFCEKMGLVESYNLMHSARLSYYDSWMEQYIPGRLAFVDGLIKEIENEC